MLAKQRRLLLGLTAVFVAIVNTERASATGLLLVTNSMLLFADQTAVLKSVFSDRHALCTIHCWRISRPKIIGQTTALGDLSRSTPEVCLPIDCRVAAWYTTCDDALLYYAVQPRNAKFPQERTYIECSAAYR